MYVVKECSMPVPVETHRDYSFDLAVEKVAIMELNVGHQQEKLKYSQLLEKIIRI